MEGEIMEGGSERRYREGGMESGRKKGRQKGRKEDVVSW